MKPVPLDPQLQWLYDVAERLEESPQVEWVNFIFGYYVPDEEPVPLIFIQVFINAPPEIQCTAEFEVDEDLQYALEGFVQNMLKWLADPSKPCPAMPYVIGDGAISWER